MNKQNKNDGKSLWKENKRLKFHLDEFGSVINMLKEDKERFKNENKQLKAEIEELKKAKEQAKRHRKRNDTEKKRHRRLNVCKLLRKSALEQRKGLVVNRKKYGNGTDKRRKLCKVYTFA